MNAMNIMVRRASLVHYSTHEELSGVNCTLKIRKYGSMTHFSWKGIAHIYTCYANSARMPADVFWRTCVIRRDFLFQFSAEPLQPYFVWNESLNEISHCKRPRKIEAESIPRQSEGHEYESVLLLKESNTKTPSVWKYSPIHHLTDTRCGSDWSKTEIAWSASFCCQILQKIKCEPYSKKRASNQSK